MSMPEHKDTPPAPDPKRGRNPGYAEPQPRDEGDARQPPEPNSRNPDERGPERDTDSEP